MDGGGRGDNENDGGRAEARLKSGAEAPQSHMKSAAGDGGDEDDLGVVGEGRGPGGEFVVDGDAQAVGGEREGVAGAEFVVETGGAGGGGRERFGAEAALFPEKREVLEVDGFHGGRGRQRVKGEGRKVKRAENGGRWEVGIFGRD